MTRTIILQQVESPAGGVYWAFNENGRIIDGLDPSELLWVVAGSLRQGGAENQVYGGARTVEERQISSFRDGALCALNKDISAVEVRARAELKTNADGNAYFEEHDR